MNLASAENSRLDVTVRDLRIGGVVGVKILMYIAQCTVELRVAFPMEIVSSCGSIN